VNADLDLAASRVVITVPASFSALAREDTLEAAHAAGFEAVQLLDEPVAALLDCLNHQDAGAFLSNEFQNVLVFDYGGGTCDLALMRAKLDADSALGMQIETLAISPYTRRGGDDVDRAIVEQVLLTNAELEDLKGTPAWKSRGVGEMRRRQHGS
jgi:molecular chaperone DnaK (HSP70)